MPPATLANVRDVVFIATIYLGFTGFLFEYAYDERFGLITSLDVDKIANVAVYAYDVLLWTIRKQTIWLGIVAVIGIAGYAIVRGEQPARTWLERSRASIAAHRTTFAAIGAICAFLVLGALARAAGSDLANERREHATAHRAFVSIAAGQTISTAIRNELLGGVVLLGERNGREIFLDQPPRTPTGVPSGKLIIVPEAAIAAAVISLEAEK